MNFIVYVRGGNFGNNVMQTWRNGRRNKRDVKARCHRITCKGYEKEKCRWRQESLKNIIFLPALMYGS